jgi:hypothetical protein
VVRVVEFDWAASRPHSRELEDWERHCFELDMDVDNDHPGSDIDPKGEQPTPLNGAVFPTPIAKTRCTMTGGCPICDGLEVRTFGGNMFQNRHPAYDRIVEFWDKAKLQVR